MKTNWISLKFAIPAMLLLITVGVALGQGPAPIKTLADIAILEDQRAIDTAKVGLWIVSDDPEIRARTAYMIGIVGDSLYRPFLAKLLEDGAKPVRLQAIFAAGQLGDSAYTQWLLRYSADGDSTIKSRAIEALSKVSSQATSTQLMAILNDSLEKPHFRALAAESVHRLRDRYSFGALVAQATNPDVAIREKVFFSLSRRANREALPFYLSGLKDANPQIRLYALSALTRVGDMSVLADIKPLLRENDWRVKYYSLGVVDKVRGRELIPEVTALLDAKEHVYVRQAAIRVLGDIGDPQASDRLTPFLDDTDINLCTEALSAIARLKKNEALTQIRQYAVSNDFRKRSAAAAACTFVDSSGRLDLLDKLAGDAIASVRGAALDLLFGADSGAIRDKYLAQALTDSDMLPAILACTRISTDRLANFLPDICTVYERATGSDGRDIKSSVLESFVEFGDSLPRIACVTNIVSSALSDKDYAIRKRGKTLAGKMKIPTGAQTESYPTAITPESYQLIHTSGVPNPVAEIKTVKGTIRIELLRNAAPKTVANYIKLAKSGFYDNRVWHRVVPDFVIQDGCPRGDGWGGPGHEIRCEYNDLPYNTGSVGMATSGKDTGGSQYFICQSPQPHLNGRYTLFGNVIEGLDVVEKIEIGDLIRSVKISEPKE